MKKYSVDVWISETIEVSAKDADEARKKACEYAQKEAVVGRYVFEAINEPEEIEE